MERFKNKIVVITGAGSGIGRSTALRLDSEGADLLMIDRNQEDLDATKNMLKNKNSSAHVVDISSINSTKNFFKDLEKNYKRLDALINIAGILRFDNSHEVELENWNQILEINLTGTFFMCRHALPLLLKSKGAIVNVSSTAALGCLLYTSPSPRD